MGAYVLSGELAAAAGNYQTAFANYEEVMRTYVDLNQKSGLTAGKGLIPSSRAGIWFNN